MNDYNKMNGSVSVAIYVGCLWEFVETSYLPALAQSIKNIIIKAFKVLIG